MSKYINAYKNLIAQKNTIKLINNRIVEKNSDIMTKEAKEWNKAHQQIKEGIYDREIESTLEKALEEMKKEAIEAVMNNVSVEVQNNATKTIQDLENQINNMFS